MYFNYFSNQPNHYDYGMQYYTPPSYYMPPYYAQRNLAPPPPMFQHYGFVPVPPPPPMNPDFGYFPAPPPRPLSPAFAPLIYPSYGLVHMAPEFDFNPALAPPMAPAFAPGDVLGEEQLHQMADYDQGHEGLLLDNHFGFGMPLPDNRPETPMTPVNPMTPTPFLREEVPQAAALPDNRPETPMTPINPMTPTPFLREEIPQAADEIAMEEDDIIEIKLEPEVIFEAKIEAPEIIEHIIAFVKKEPLIKEEQIANLLPIKEEINEEEDINFGFNIMPRGEIAPVYSPLICRDIDEHWEVAIDPREEELRNTATPEPAAVIPGPATTCNCVCKTCEAQAAKKRGGRTARKRTSQAARNKAGQQKTSTKRRRPSKAEPTRKAAGKRAGSKK